MFSFLVRGLGFLVLVLAVIAAVLDLTRSIAASEVLITSFHKMWANYAPASLDAVQQFTRSAVSPFVWDAVIMSLISLPSWLVLWALSMLLLWLGQPRENPFGRFASD